MIVRRDCQECFLERIQSRDDGSRLSIFEFENLNATQPSFADQSHRGEQLGDEV